MDAFDKGYYGYRDFVQAIENLVKTESDLSGPNILDYEEKAISRRTDRKTDGGAKVSGFTPNQMLKLGWSGEEYIAYLLRIRDEKLLDALKIPRDASYEINWFNEGVQNAEDEISFLDLEKLGSFSELVKNWEDKSVGKGCDIVVTMEPESVVYIEVKTSKRLYPYFKMTSVEMQEMEKRGSQYALIKINNIERLLRGDSPDVITIIDPFEKLFHPRQMKEATFVVGGK